MDECKPLGRGGSEAAAAVAGRGRKQWSRDTLLMAVMAQTGILLLLLLVICMLGLLVVMRGGGAGKFM